MRFCDLVMKGGITSGLVYPQAVLELSKVYRFKNIGGTSAGAIAAAISAAAALGERRKFFDKGLVATSPVGMEGLARAAADLRREGFIYSLFQPLPKAKPAFDLLVTLAAKPNRRVAAFAIAKALARLAPVTMLGVLMSIALTGLIVGYLGGDAWAGALGALLPALACTLAAGLARAASLAVSAASSNKLGFCPGISQDGSPALTDWMHDTIRAIAGLTDDAGRPLTFGDLWGAQTYDGEPTSERTINLEIITTDVSHCEPRTLPFARGGFWYSPDEFRTLFPEPVVAWMDEHSSSVKIEGGITYRQLPADRDFPIVVAARMSLSFPLLICAIPLYELDVSKSVEAREVRPDASQSARHGERPSASESADELTAGGASVAERTRDLPLRKCWFTDGGVSSNFPIHLFDAPMPRWPTFAIDLVYPDSEGVVSDAVFLPTSNNQGWQPRYQKITGITDFVMGIVGTMQNWRDLLQGRAPGHRDRIVRIGLAKTEGGMNLNMPEDILRNVSDKGAVAGAKLAAEFDFDNHYWIRYRTLASAVERFTINLGAGLVKPLGPDHQAAYEQMWSEQASGAPYGFTKAQAQEASSRLERIRAEAELWVTSEVDLTEGAPRPLPLLKIIPTF